MIIAERTKIVYRVLERRAAQGTLTDKTMDCLVYFMARRRGIDQSPAEKYDADFEVIVLLKDLPRAERWISTILKYDQPRNVYDDGDYERFLEKVYSLPNGVGKKPVAEACYRIEEYVRSRSITPTATPPPTPRVGEDTVRFEKLEFVAVDKNGEGVDWSGDLLGCVPCGPNVDFLWDREALYIMKEPGKLRLVYRSSELREYRFRFVSPCYDGRYVWVPAIQTEEPFLAVVDPESEKVMTFGSSHGLPPMSTQVATAALSRGKVFFAGCFGGALSGQRLRSWLAILNLGDDNRLTVDVFHKALTGADAYAADSCFVIEGEQVGSSQTVIVCSRPYLIVDVDKRLVRTPQIPFYEVPSFCRPIMHANRIYWVWDHRIWSIGWPDLDHPQPGPAMPGWDCGLIVFYMGKVHYVGYKWWTAEKLGDPFRKRATKVPQWDESYAVILRSRNYGLLYHEPNGRATHRIVFEE